MAERVGQIYYEISLDTSKAIAGQREVDRIVGKAAGTFNVITRAVISYGAALQALDLLKRADEFRLLASRVQVAAGGIQAGAEALSEIVSISRRTQTAVGDNATVFTRLNASVLELGGTERDTLGLTELLSKAIKVSGATALESRSAMLQFAQALGSGRLQGDELRSLLENAPYLMRQLADGIGVPIGALKKLGEEGKLTSRVVLDALAAARARIEEDFKKVPQTLEGAFTVARDQATLAITKFDELEGSSATLTGVVKGTGQVFEKLAEQISAADVEAAKLGREKTVRSWAETVREGLSYVVDALDVVWQTVSVLGRNVEFVFTGIGAEIRGIFEQVKAVARGDFAEVEAISARMKAMAAMRRKDLDDADAKTLGRGLAGQRMRAAWEQEAAMRSIEDRGFTPNPSRGRGGGGGGGGGAGKPKKDYFNEAQDELEERLRVAYDKIADSEIEAMQKAQEKVDREREKGRVFAAGVAIDGDPIAQARAEYEAKSQLLAEYAERDQANAELYALARINLEEQTQARIRDIVAQQQAYEEAAQRASLAIVSDGMGQILGLLQQSGKERTALAKALFLAQKAIAVAEIIMNTEIGAAKAIGQAGPFGIPLASFIRATGYASAGMVAGLAIAQVSGGRQYGGPVSSGSLYRVNEAGRPEMFTAANGNQYMLPTADGRVTAADQVGSRGVALQVQVINNHPTAKVSASQDETGRIAQIVISEIASQFRENSGPAWAALRGSSNVQGRL